MALQSGIVGLTNGTWTANSIEIIVGWTVKLRYGGALELNS